MMRNVTAGGFPILLVDNDADALESTRELLLGSGVSPVYTTSDSRTVLSFLEHHPVSFILLDLNVSHEQGMALLAHLRNKYPHIPAIIAAEASDAETAVACMKAGASDYLVKPLNINRLISSVKHAVHLEKTLQEVTHLKDYLLHRRPSHPEIFNGINTNSSKMRAVFQYAEVVSVSPLPVMITGETGVGKELFARALHRLSGVKGDFVTVNVAGLDDAMFTDTLFGHKKGAFTGADQARDGLICKASGGTIFLDEIGELKEQSQVKLLRLLQEREYYPVGSDTLKTSKARVILATNVDLESRIRQGKFRRDLYYRLCTHMITIPPLRERKEDIPLLLDFFVEKAAQQLKKYNPPASDELIKALECYPFPGNVRELHAMVYDAMTRHVDGPLTLEHFPGIPPAPVTDAVEANTDTDPYQNGIYALFGRLPTFREIEDYLIEEALKISGGSLAAASTLLGVTRQTISNRLKQKA